MPPVSSLRKLSIENTQRLVNDCSVRVKKNPNTWKQIKNKAVLDKQNRFTPRLQWCYDEYL